MRILRKRVVVAAGGTGGHINPALAVAEEFRNNGDTVLFMGGLYGPEKEKAEKAGFDFIGVDVRGFNRNNLWEAFKAMLAFPSAVMKAYRTLNVFAPQAVIGAGGYASGPAAVGAVLKGIPLFLMEQNVFPGLVTRKLAKKAARVFTSFPESSGWLKGAKVTVTGNPVKGAFSFAEKRKEPEKAFTILVMGGSQGAASINRAVMDALPLLKEMKVMVIHQTGEKDLEEVKAAYRRVGLYGEVAAYFEEMEKLMAKADMAFCRAGASTCAELAISGLPAVLVPYPYAGGHQELNAKAMVQGGAARMVRDEDLDGNRVAGLVNELMADRDGLELMAANAREMARPDSAARIYNEVTGMVA